MKYTKLLVASIFVLLFFSACSKEREYLPVIAEERDELPVFVTEVLGEHELKFGETITSYDKAFSLMIDEIIDFRCPLTHNCLWAGYAEVKFRLRIDEVAYTLELDTCNGCISNYFSEVGGYVITLTEVSPYPANGDPIPDEEYLIRITIE